MLPKVTTSSIWSRLPLWCDCSAVWYLMLSAGHLKSKNMLIV